jgi:hypothetical protein
MIDPLIVVKTALSKLSGHYTLIEWSEQTSEIIRVLPSLIVEIERLRASEKKT